MSLSLVNVVNVSVSAAPAGVGAYNTSNLALFTNEVPVGTFGSLGYKLYLEPTEVATDFGSTSDTAQMATAVFSQSPSILTGGGYLVVILQAASVSPIIEEQLISFSSVPTAGTYKIKIGSLVTSALAFNAASATIQTAVRLLTGMGSVNVDGDYTGGMSFSFAGVSGDVALMEITANKLQDTGGIDVFLTVTEVAKGVAAGTPEALSAAITRSSSLVQYFGVICNQILGLYPMQNAAAVIQSLNKIMFVVRNDVYSVAPGGILDTLRSGSYTQTRGLYYGGDETDLPPRLMLAAYASRALSTDFSGSKTTQTMHLKDLATIQPDATVTQTVLGQCQTAGVDVYVSLQGVPKVFTSGANKFFDQVYNQQWFVGALQVAGFNALATSSNKLPQTEDGVSILKAAYRTVCEAALSNQYGAPGTWTGSSTFGNLADFVRNIGERGYYIYSLPVSQQLTVDRAARKCPLVQIALKESGAIHSTSVIVNINQ